MYFENPMTTQNGSIGVASRRKVNGDTQER